MIFLIELGKIFRRKFNYLFSIIILTISLGVLYKMDSLTNFYDYTEVDVIFNIIFKIILILVIFIHIEKTILQKLAHLL